MHGGQSSSKMTGQYSFCLFILWTKKSQGSWCDRLGSTASCTIPAQSMEKSMEKTSRRSILGRHQSCYWEKDWTFLSDSIECNHPSRNTSSSLFFRKLLGWENWRSPFTKKVCTCHLGPPRKDLLETTRVKKENWVSEHAQRSEVGQPSRSFPIAPTNSKSKPWENGVTPLSRMTRETVQDGRKNVPLLRRSMLVSFSQRICFFSKKRSDPVIENECNPSTFHLKDIKDPKRWKRHMENEGDSLLKQTQKNVPDSFSKHVSFHESENIQTLETKNTSWKKQGDPLLIMDNLSHGPKQWWMRWKTWDFQNSRDYHILLWNMHHSNQRSRIDSEKLRTTQIDTLFKQDLRQKSSI